MQRGTENRDGACVLGAHRPQVEMGDKDIFKPMKLNLWLC